MPVWENEVKQTCQDDLLLGAAIMAPDRSGTVKFI